VILLRELAIGAYDLFLGHLCRDAEHFVIVLFEPLALCSHRFSLPANLHHCRAHNFAL